MAREANVSIGAVSNAMNGRKGVSEATRARVQEAAARLGWSPSAVARSLMSGRTAAVGLVLARRPDALQGNVYFAGFMAGVEQVLSEHDRTLLVQVAPDLDQDAETHRRWLASRPADGLLLVDLAVDDPRVAAVAALETTAVVAHDAPDVLGLPTAWLDDAAAMAEAIDHLQGLGHRRIAHVEGPPGRAASRTRSAAFAAACRSTGVEGVAVPDDEPGDTTARVLALDPRPTAIVYDDDLTAVHGLGEAFSVGLRVPQDLSLVAWSDSPVLQATTPHLTAVGYDAAAFGAAAAGLLLELLAGEPPHDLRAAVPTVRYRASTAAVPSTD